jgi:hypothetical protein
MPLENDPQVPVMPINGKGASSSTDPTYNVRMLMASENNALRELAMAEIRHVEEMQKLHVSYQEKLTVAESKRIDAILSANVAAAETDRERTTAQAAVLAAQVASSAETLRALVASTAQATATQYQASHSQVLDRVALLEKAQYTGMGRSVNEANYGDRLGAIEKLNAQSVGRSALSQPIMMLIAGLGGGLLVWIVQLIIAGFVK